MMQQYDEDDKETVRALFANVILKQQESRSNVRRTAIVLLKRITARLSLPTMRDLRI